MAGQYLNSFASFFFCLAVFAPVTATLRAQAQAQAPSIASRPSREESQTGSVTIDADDAPLEDVLRRIASQAGLTPFYSSAVRNRGLRVTVHARDVSARYAFDLALRGTGLTSVVSGDRVAFVDHDANFGRGGITGTVIDADNLAPLRRATVILDETGRRLLTDEAGTFSLSGVEAGEHRITVKSIGYGRQTQTVFVPVNQTATIQARLRLNKPSTTLDDVTILSTLARADQSITATKTSTPLIETPQSITVVTRQQMEARGVQTLNDALRYTAAVTAQAAGRDTRFDRIFIRGFDQTIAPYRDGTRWGGDVEGGTETYGLEQVEVLRGPSSVLYGQNGPGGLVNATTKRPTGLPQQELRYQTGSYNRQQLAGDFDGSIDSAGHWRYRLTGLGRVSGTSIARTKDDRVFFAPALTWAPSDRTALTILTSFQRDNTGFLLQWLPSRGTALHNPNGEISRNQFLSIPDFDHYDRTSYNLGYIFDQRVGSWSLRQNARYTNSHVSSGVAYGVGLQNDLRTLNRDVSLGDLKHAAWTVDNQASRVLTRGAVEQTLLFGFDYRRIVSREAFGIIRAEPIDIFHPVYTPVGDITLPNAPTITGNQFGFYAQDQLKLGPHWAVLGGGRIDWVKTLADNPVTNVQTNEHERAMSGRFGLVYLSPNGLAPYVSYSRSFTPVFGTSLYGDRFKPETGKQVELGLKYQPKHWNGFVTAAVFDIRRQNVRTGDPSNPNFEIQTGEQRSRGVEFEGNVSPVSGLNVFTSYSITDIRVTKSNGPDLKKRPPLAPKHLASAWFDYKLPQGMLSSISVGGGVRYVGPTFGDPANTFVVRSHTLIDGMLKYAFENWSVTFNARNLFDKAFVKCWAADACNWGERRSFTIGLGFRR